MPGGHFFYEYPRQAYLVQSLHSQLESDYSSYGLNGGNFGADSEPHPAFLNQTTLPGVSGWKQGSIRDPVNTVLLMEIPAFFPWSWHEPRKLRRGLWGVNDAKNVISFVDGHVSYTKIYWNTNYNLSACCYDPPSGYDYKRMAN